MHINRRTNRPLFAARRSRRTGCIPFMIVLTLMIGFVVVSRDWIANWLLKNPQTTHSISRAEAAFANGDLDTTIEQARHVWEAEPDNADALILLVRALVYRSYTDYNNAQDRQRALQLTTGAYGQPILRTRVQGIHAFALQANEQSADATRMASAAIQREYDNMPARVAQAFGYAQQGLFDAALREARTAVEIAQSTGSPWVMDAYRTMAVILGDMGRYNEATEAVNQAIALNRRMIPLYFEQALYAMQVSNTNNATASYFQVIALDENNAKAHLRLCEISIGLREREAAVNYCTKATELAPAWSDAWYQLGREFFLEGSLTKARDALGRCTTLQTLQNMPIEERRFECWYLQGQAAEALGDCDTLVPLYNQFQAMAAASNIPQTWTYPPEGPPRCVPVS
ncbi:tetratricopeptide repeat protein [Phototrophicus methaneseepsis]|uniref:Tetratricopeptide repeat protein n=1 Tax=Phototrophicus methaneseepsis TaxID=2710758 RepID=A0A7S8ECN7_9CHLR|nr:tetratricopeptide repeat protein [Phototrophicus methaneseepsis]QPC84527.1 tetratricopeptide repeat protein [Phototrophicus methaneseepsis]